MKMKRVLVSISFVLFVAVFFTSCGRIELYQNLTEEDANEMMVLLSENGIKANKKKVMQQNDVSYSIAVPDGEMVKARSLLVRHNLPRRRELGLTGVYKEKGLIPTPDEQKARFLLALKGEIINSLERIPQIVDADVVLNVPSKDEFADAEARHRQRPTSSIVIKAKPLDSGEGALSESKLQQFVSNAVEGMNPRDVTVVITYLPSTGQTFKPGDIKTFPRTGPSVGSQAQMPPPVFSDEIIGLKLDTESKDKLKMYLLIFFLILIVLSAALIVVIVQGSRTRRDLIDLQTQVGDHPAIEGHIMNEGPPELPGPQM
jgi:type III secretion system YscJ/HrcJ family lipoprotein